MGQTDSKQEQDFLRKIETQYEFIKLLNDARYGDGKLFGKKNDKTQQIVLKNINVPDEINYQAWKKKIQSRDTLKHQNIIELKESIQSEQEQVCSTHYRITIVFEYIQQTLKDALEQRKEAGAYYLETEILKMMYGAIDGLAKFQNSNIAHQNLRVQTLSYKDGIIKISDIPLLTNVTQFDAVIQAYGKNTEGFYLSPILTKAVYENNHMPIHNRFKSDVYTLGMIFLQVCLLQPQDKCYDYQDGQINMQQLITSIEQARGIFTSDLIGILEEMLEQNEKDRPDFIQLNNKIKNQPSIYQQNNNNDDNNYEELVYNTKKVMQMELNLSNHDNNSYQDLGPMPLDEDENQNYIKPLSEPQPSQPSDHDVLINNADITRNSISPLKQNNSIGNVQKNQIQEFQVQPISFASNNNNFQYDNIHKNPEIKNSNYLDKYNVLPIKQDAFTQSSQIFNNQQQKSNISLQQYVSYQPYRESLNVNDQIDKFHFSSPKDFQVQELKQSNFDYQQKEIKVQELKQSNFDYLQKDPTSTYQQPSRFLSQQPSQSTYVNETYPNGQKYIGEKKNGQKEGRGRLYYKEGGYYDGNWRNDKINGQGVLYYASGRPAYDGEWVDDKFQGNGILYNDTPKIEDFDYRNLEEIGCAWTKYAGQFYDDNKCGKGTLYFLNGDRFEGQFQDDQATGLGRYISISGQVFQGIWQYNRFVQ